MSFISLNDMKDYIFYFLMALVCCSCLQDKKNPDQGEIIQKYYPDGKLHKEIPLRQGKNHGVAKEYYKNGQLFQAIHYVNGTRHGIARQYYDNGKLSRETPYDSGQITGIRKKYRRDGMLQAEIPYVADQECIGLKEYTLKGTLKNDYPTIVVTPVNRLKENKYSLQLSMSDDSKNVKFFIGELAEGKYLSPFMVKEVPTNSQGMPTAEFTIPAGHFVKEKLNIIARMKTRLGNVYITQRQYYVDVENP
jgi:hypothetical protein